jgi:hypothetical protein
MPAWIDSAADTMKAAPSPLRAPGVRAGIRAGIASVCKHERAGSDEGDRHDGDGRRGHSMNVFG